MESSLLTSIGIAAFSSVMYFGYQYANGKWKVPESKKTAYLNWSIKHGKTVKRSIIVISLFYVFAMLIQILGLV